MRAGTRRLLGLFAVPFSVALALTTALTAPSAAAPTITRSDPPPASIPSRYLKQTVAWTPCTVINREVQAVVAKAPTTNCATVRVPMDWLHPDAHPDIDLAIALSKATGTSRGLLTVNPGGPGVPGLDQSAMLGRAKPKLFAAYDLLGFDPRGYGLSEEHTCYSTQRAYDARRSVPDPRVRNVKTHEAEVSEAKFWGQACAVAEFSQFVNTQQTVYDLEFLRQFVGRGAPAYDKLNYVGVSYGTWLGAWYADTYPSHTGRFLLDSNMNWTSTMYANQASDSFSFERRRDLMFFPWVARHAKTYKFGKTSAEVKANYDKLRTKLSQAAQRGDQDTEQPVDFDVTIQVDLYTDDSLSDAMDEIEFASDGLQLPDRARRDAKARKPRSAVRVQRLSGHASVAVRSSAKASTLEDIGTADSPVRCNDSAYSRDLSTLLKRADRDARSYPFSGYQNTVGMCSYWRYAPVTRTIDLTGAPTLLMLQSEGDPATAYEGALAAHRATASHTRLVSVDNEGEHGVYAFGVSPCVDKIGDAFLLAGTLPSTDVTCGTLPMPGDGKVYPLNGPLDGHSYPLDTATALTSKQQRAQQQRQQAKLDAAARSMR